MDSVQQDNETVSLKHIIVNYLYHWKLFVGVGCLSLIPAILYLVLYPKTYDVMARFKIQEEQAFNSGGGIGLGDAAGLMKSFGLGGSSGGVMNLDDEVATLSSNWLLEKVVLKLGLNVTYQKPFSFVQLYEDSPLLVVPDSLTQVNLDKGVLLSVSVKEDGSVKIEDQTGDKMYSFSSLPAKLNLSEGSFDIFYRESSLIEKPFKLKVTISPASWVAEDLSEKIEIDEFSKNANTLELMCSDYSKIRGKDLLNILMDEYNKNTRYIKSEEADRAMSFLDTRIQGVTMELNKVERSIESYKIQNRITDIEYDVQFYADAVKDLRERIIEVESQKQVLNLLEDYIKDPKNRYNLIPSILSSEGEKGGAITVYNEALIERDRVRKSSTSESPLSEMADNQIDKLRASVVVSIDNAQKSSQYILEDLRKQEKSIWDKMGNVPTNEREFLDLKRQQEILQGVYLILLQKKEEIALILGQDRERGFILDAAFVKHRPIAPRKLYAGLFMMVFTLIIPVGYLFCRERFLSLKEEFLKHKASN